MGSSVPNTKTRPGNPSNATVQALQKRLEGLENQIARINANRTPEPTLVHELSNAGPMAQVQDGQGLVYSAADGQYHPGQNFHFILANIVTDPSAPNSVWDIFGTFPPYLLEVQATAGFQPPFAGQAIFEIFIEGLSANHAGTLSIGCDTGPSIGRFWADTLSFGGAAAGLPGPTLGAGIMGFYGSAGNTQQTVTGSRGGNAALASLLTILGNSIAGLGLVVDGTTP